MVFIYREGKINENSYLIDGYIFGAARGLALYIIENNGNRLLIDTSTAETAGRIIEKLKEFNIYPIHKILLTHAHWDHAAGANELKRLISETDIEILASENAIHNLKNPNAMNEVFGHKMDPVEGVVPLKEGDIIDLNGLKLEIFNFFGHTMDSIAVLDEKNRNLFVGDAIMNKSGYAFRQPAFMPPEFNEPALLNTYQKLRTLKERIDSISLSHFGVWSGEDLNFYIDEMEKFHFDTKNSIIQWYKKGLSSRELTLEYLEKFLPKAKILEYDMLDNLEMNVKWLIEGLKGSGLI
ncbi:MAG: MBL fold metallo-hydrolase [Promethearchaeota archaeon]|jgi:glyoxylase-like metal-dependent hydrolase (beta-lactamase superfamily II)